MHSMVHGEDLMQPSTYMRINGVEERRTSLCITTIVKGFSTTFYSTSLYI